MTFVGLVFDILALVSDGGVRAVGDKISLERAAKKWVPVFRESRAFSKNLEPVAIQLKRNKL